ncbi:MAG: MFS transporter [Roseiarcus sp.]|jgi:MFS family permease
MPGKADVKLDYATLRRIPRSIWSLGFVSLLMDVSSEMIHALLPVYLVSVMGTSNLTVGVIEGVGEATANIAKIFSGAFSDWIGHRKVVVALGYGLAAFSKPLFALAPNAGWIMAARFIDRMGKGVRDAPRDALIADLTPQAVRGASYGLRQALDTVGGFVGPLLGILFMWLSGDRYRIVFWIAVVPAFLSMAFMIFGVQEPEGAGKAGRPAAPFGRAALARLGAATWMIVAVGTVFALAQFSAAFLILKARAAGLPVALAPLVYITMNVVFALGAYPAGVLSDRGDRAQLLTWGLIFLMLADFALALSSNLIGVAIGLVLWGLCLAFTQGVLSAMIADKAPRELRGTAFGVFNFAAGIALLAASSVAGALWDAYGPTATFLVGAAFACLALIGLTIVRGRIGPTDGKSSVAPKSAASGAGAPR